MVEVESVIDATGRDAPYEDKAGRPPHVIYLDFPDCLIGLCGCSLAVNINAFPGLVAFLGDFLSGDLELVMYMMPHRGSLGGSMC